MYVYIIHIYTSVLRVTFKCSNLLLPDSLFLRDSATHNCLTTVSTPVLLKDEYFHFCFWMWKVSITNTVINLPAQLLSILAEWEGDENFNTLGFFSQT